MSHCQKPNLESYTTYFILETRHHQSISWVYRLTGAIPCLCLHYSCILADLLVCVIFLSCIPYHSSISYPLSPLHLVFPCHWYLAQRLSTQNPRHHYNKPFLVQKIKKIKTSKKKNQKNQKSKNITNIKRYQNNRKHKIPKIICSSSHLSSISLHQIQASHHLSKHCPLIKIVNYQININHNLSPSYLEPILHQQNMIQSSIDSCLRICRSYDRQNLSNHHLIPALGYIFPTIGRINHIIIYLGKRDNGYLFGSLVF